MNVKYLIVPFLVAGCSFLAEAVPVKVTMNNVSPTMTLTDRATGEAVETGDPVSRVYNFDVPAGEYVLTAIAGNGETVNGTIVLNVKDQTEEQTFSVLTVTMYAANRYNDESRTPWTVENGDYTIDVTVTSREGDLQTVTTGHSTTSGRYTVPALNGNTCYAEFIPSEAHRQEGYIALERSATLTYNATINGEIPMAYDYTISVPADAELFVGSKTAHYIDFKAQQPKSVVKAGDRKLYTYFLAEKSMYNLRTWKEGGLTQAGLFTAAKDGYIEFTESDYSAFDPKQINHDPKSNQGYETGDIFVNINPQGQLKMNVGDEFDAHAMRTWELTNTSAGNYFFEPDFHYRVVGLDGKPSTGVIEIDNSKIHTSAWAKIKAVGTGTAIVLVTYDAISVTYYNHPVNSKFMGGQYWGAIWPENTAVYVVTVGEDAAGINPNMVINEDYNKETSKLAGKYVDAEHDVFYYLDTEEGYRYTFTPEGVDKVTIAYPTIGEQTVSYSGFGPEGVTANEDGSYTLLLKEGRQIVQLSDASGKSVYQVLTAKKCHREITNNTREGSNIFQPGDEVTIQYSGLFHPANKLAGIYNMSAYVTYNGVPNGTSLILGSGQYTFGSVPHAQAVTFTIPEDFDTEANHEVTMDKGVIQVNGFGDPIGNHRNIDPVAGRSPNFTAIGHKTYFGAIPEVSIPISPVRYITILFKSNVENPDLVVTYKGKELAPEAPGVYKGTFGTYSVVASKAGYRCYRFEFSLTENTSDEHAVYFTMEEAEGAWDGKTLTEPEKEEDTYLISNGEELAWFAAHVNEGNADVNARLTKDIDLGDYDWTPIAYDWKTFSGVFDGQGHNVTGLYFNNPDTNSPVGLFGYLVNGEIKNLNLTCSVVGKSEVGGLVGRTQEGKVSEVRIHGSVSGNLYAGGVIGNLNSVILDRCANFATVASRTTHAGGICGVAMNRWAITNSYNIGEITARSYLAGGISGEIYSYSLIEAKDIFNIGKISAPYRTGACFGFSDGTNDKFANIFATEEYDNTDNTTLVTEAQMRSGEIAYKLGEAFGQEIGVDEYPVIGGMEVFYDETTDTYYNKKESGIESITADGTEIECYFNLEGIRSDVPFKGFNIVLMSDGSSRKVFIK